jgi:hypothetical protein
MHRSLLAATVLLGSIGSAPAQVQRGDIAITGFSSTAFGVLGAGNVVTGYTTPGFLGTGTSQCVLWDRQNTNAFLIGGFGFVGRATVLGPGVVVYGLVTANVGIASQLSWDGAGVVVVDSGTNQLRRLDPVSGAVVDLSTGTQPWGADLSAGAFDPVRGDVVVGGNGAIWRFSLATGTATPLASSLGGYVSGIAFDPVTGDVVATVLTVNRVIRVDAGGLVTNVAPQGSVPGPNALDVDQNGDFVTGGGTGQVYRVPRGGGAPMFLASNTSPANAVNGLAVAGAGGYGIGYGPACSAQFGPAVLTASGPFLVNATIATSSSNHAAGALGVLALGLDRTSHLGLPLPFLVDGLFGTNGCHLNVALDVTFGGVAAASAPAALVFPIAIPPAFAGQQFFAQHVALEPVPGSLSFSNGLAIRIP